MVSSKQAVNVTFFESAKYCIYVQARLDLCLSDRLGGMVLTQTQREDGSPLTILSGQLSDQAELIGVLNSLYDLHVPIISIQAIDIDRDCCLLYESQSVKEFLTDE